MTLYPKLILDVLATVLYPGTKKNLVESAMVVDNEIIVNGMKVEFTLLFPRETDPSLIPGDFSFSHGQGVKG